MSPIAKCESIFKEFAECSVLELADMAHGLISPVILGMCKPTTSKLTQSTSGGEFSLAEELFNIEPSIQRQQSFTLSTSLVKVKLRTIRDDCAGKSTMPPPEIVFENDPSNSSDSERFKTKRAHSNSSASDLSPPDDETSSSGFSTVALKNGRSVDFTARSKRRSDNQASTSGGKQSAAQTKRTSFLVDFDDMDTIDFSSASSEENSNEKLNNEDSEDNTESRKPNRVSSWTH